MRSIRAKTTDVTGTNRGPQLCLVQRRTVFSVCVSVLCGVAFVLAAAQVRKAADGVYSDAQAKRGEAIYADRCASCHAPDLSGMDQAPPLAGADFLTNWNDQTLNDLFEKTRV